MAITAADINRLQMEHYRELALKGEFDYDPQLKALILVQTSGLMKDIDAIREGCAALDETWKK